MRAVGVPFDKPVIANLETGRRRFVTVQELFALAYVLNVAPIHLVVPVDVEGGERYRVAPDGVEERPMYAVRGWIRGERPIAQQDKRRYFAEQPADEYQPPASQLDAAKSEELGPDGKRRPVDVEAYARDEAAARDRKRAEREALSDSSDVS